MMRSIVYIICIIGWVQTLAQTDVRSYIERGNALYAKQDFRSAAVTYKQACILDSSNFDAWYNFGNALYKLDKFILASDAYNKALQLTPDAKLQAQALYNIGNSYLKQDELQPAIDSYKKSLLLNPAQPDCRYNLAYALKLQEQKQKNENDSKNKQDKQKKPEISAFAQQCKAQADALVAQNKFSEAYEVMNQGLKKDKSIGEYQDYIQRLQKICELTNSTQMP